MAQRISTFFCALTLFLGIIICNNPSNNNIVTERNADLVGEWKITRTIISGQEQNVSEISIFFNGDGTYEKTQKPGGVIESGVWNTSGEKLNLNIENQAPNTNTYSFDGTVLIITNSAGTIITYYSKKDVTNNGNDTLDDKTYEDSLWFGGKSKSALFVGDTNNMRLELRIYKNTDIFSDSIYRIDEYLSERDKSFKQIFQESGTYSLNDSTIRLNPKSCASIHTIFTTRDTTIITPASCSGSIPLTLSDNKLVIRYLMTTYILKKQ